MKYLFLFFVCALFASCFNEGDCLITATNQLRIQFRKKTSTKTDSLIVFNSIVVSGTDTILIPSSSVREILLPIDVNADTTLFVFNRLNPADNSNVADSLVLSYTRQGKVISKDCGAYTFYQDLKIKKTNLTDIKTYSISLIKAPTGSPTDFNSYALNYQILY